jgi:hypothetical protein
MYGTLVFQSFASLYDFQILLFTKIAHITYTLDSILSIPSQ